jgi:hypothetical protein
MKRIGILHGRERSFPQAFCTEINSRNASVVAVPVALTEDHCGKRYKCAPVGE